MFGTEHMFGSMEFETHLTQAPDGDWTASAMGLTATHRDREQSLNDLNQKIDTAVISGELRPDTN